MKTKTKKCAAAVALGKMGKGVKRKFSPEEIAKRTARLRLTRNHLKHKGLAP